MKYVYLFLIFTCSILASAQDVKKTYHDAYNELKGMLTDSLPLSFKKAVFVTENAYFNNELKYHDFNNTIKLLAVYSQQLANQGNLHYSGSDKEIVKKYWAAFVIMTDSIKFKSDSSRIFSTVPYKYDFEDFWGEKNWTKMFVSKLLNSHKGNCHSLPFLYKMICEELGVKAWLAMAPNHIYIKLRTKNTGWFNTELTNGYFPIDAWIMASGYIHLNAVQNKIYMDTLSQKQSIALNVIDLAKGYQRKFPQDLDFAEKCADLTLIYYPNYINALLLKTELKKKRFERLMDVAGAHYPSDILGNPEAKLIFDDMEKRYKNIYDLGYRMMPKEMYANWLADLNKEKKRYLNQDVINNFKSEQK